MTLLLVCLLSLSSFCQDPESPPVVKPEDAAQHVNKTVIVEMEVASSSFLKDRELCFLNSLKDHRSEKNFSVVLRKEGLQSCQENGVEDPAKHFLKKKVRIQGKVELYNKKPQIIVTQFEQLKVVGIRPEE
jgi:DNA/RNA endonuclease YhcR with UshA esterase domain